jgi:hypothetical protein
MKKALGILLILIAPVAAFSQTAMQWQQIYGGPGVEVGYGVKSCLDQGYIVAGSSSSSGPTDGYVVRTDSVGLVMWAKYYGGINIDVIRSIKVLPDSGFIMAGFTNSYGNGGYDGWVIRIDKNGDTLWTKSIGTTNWDFFYDVTTTYDNGFVLAGGTYGIGNGDEDVWFVKLDANGVIQWSRTYGGIKQDEARGVIETSDSLLAACGFTCSLGDTLGDTWEFRINPVQGDTIWTRKGLHTVGADRALGIAAGNGRFGIVGQYTTATGDQNAFIHVMINDSTTQLNITNGIVGYEYFSSIVFLTTSYNIATLGDTENDGGGHGDFFLFHDINYASFTYGTVGEELGYGIDEAHGKGYITCGYTTGFNSIVPNLYLVRIDSSGNSSLVLAIREPSVFETKLSLFPNPSSNLVNVIVDSKNPISDQLVMNICDMSGRIIAIIDNEEWTRTSSGTATCQFSVAQLTDGIYQCVISNGNEVLGTDKLVVAH